MTGAAVHVDECCRQRVLLLLTTHRDAELSADLLGRNGIDSCICTDAAVLQAELQRGAGVVLVAEECLAQGAQAVLARAVEAQPRWSDLPVLLLTRGGADSLEVGDAVGLLRNVTLLERPLRVVALLSAVNSALRARHRQYQIASYLRELESARELEAEAMRRKDEFLAMLAHELRNPLAPIRNALHVLSIDDSDAARRRALRAMMTRQVEHMVRLVDDLLEASRLSRGMITLHRDRHDLREALRGAIELSAPLLERAGVALELDLADCEVPVDVDVVRIVQVFGNLLNNAAKFGHRGGRITVRAWCEDDAALVEVRDDGVGIEADALPHIFELFTQGGLRPGDAMPEGLGIGLALVKRLVELHGGQVHAHSDGEDRGASFTVRLPLARAMAATPLPAPDAPTLAGPLRVLVVDDNVDAAVSTAMLLETLDVSARVAHDGAAALRIAGEYQPDVVLLDIGMPGMDGYEVARRLRADARCGDPVLVAVTGWAHEQDLQRSAAAGFDHHFAKPLDIGRLHALLCGLSLPGGLDAMDVAPRVATSPAAASR